MMRSRGMGCIKPVAFKKGGATKDECYRKVKKQGYNDRLDESLGARNGKKSQSLKSRRDESKGMEKSMGKGAYSGASTMMAKGGKVGKSSASSRADGIAVKGHTRGRMV